MRIFANKFTQKHLFIVFIITSIISIGNIVIADISSGTSSVGSSSNVTITQLVVNKPAVTATGDFMLAGITVNGGSPASVTAPTGWNLILRTDNDTNVSVLSYYKFASVSEPSSYTWTINSQTRAAGGITLYDNVDSMNPIDVKAGDSGYSTSATAPSITTTKGYAKIVTLFSYNAGTTNVDHFATPAGMTEEYETTNTPFGPSMSSHNVTQLVAGVSGTRSSNLGAGPKRNWVAQQIALRSIVTSDDFNEYADGNLNNLNGGTGWANAWTGSVAFNVQNTVTKEGAKGVKLTLAPGNEPAIKRQFVPKTSGVVHWAQRKDGGSHGQGISLRSGSTLVTYAQVGSDVGQPGLEWISLDGQTNYIIQPYTLSSFDTVDIEFDTVTDKYKISINGGPYSGWKNFANDVSSIDTVEFITSSAGEQTVDMYWDDISISRLQ